MNLRTNEQSLIDKIIELANVEFETDLKVSEVEIITCFTQIIAMPTHVVLMPTQVVLMPT